MLRSADPVTTVLNSIFVKLVTDSLSEYSYNAQLAELWYVVQSTDNGIEVSG